MDDSYGDINGKLAVSENVAGTGGIIETLERNEPQQKFF